MSDEGVARYNSNKTLAIYQFKIRAAIFSKQTNFSTRFASRGTRLNYRLYLKVKRSQKTALKSVEKPLQNFKTGCRLLLALLVLHRAKLLASNQSVLALGRSPRTGRQPFVSLHRAVTLCG